jgi:hypothetical protein
VTGVPAALAFGDRPEHWFQVDDGCPVERFEIVDLDAQVFNGENPYPVQSGWRTSSSCRGACAKSISVDSTRPIGTTS